MPVNIEIADWLGIGIASIFFLIYAGISLYPHILSHDEVYKLGLWSAAIAFANAILQSAFLKDIGLVLRWDGKEFNWLRWVIITLTITLSHAIATCHGWHDFVEGHAAIAAALLSGLCFLFAGLSSHEPRWLWFTFGLLAYVISAVIILARADYDPLRGKLKRAMLFIYLLLTTVFYTLNIIVLFFSPELLNIIKNITVRDWVYWAGTNGLVIAPLLAVLFYQPVPESKINNAYATVPNASNSNGNMAAVDASLMQTKNKAH
jgi:hypothetical protein